VRDGSSWTTPLEARSPQSEGHRAAEGPAPYGTGDILVLSLPQVVELWGAARVLKRLRVEGKPIDDMADAAWEALADLATPGKRLHLSTREANRVALDLLDACATLPEDDPGATLARSVVEVIGTELASMEFDSRIPGSGQVMQAWRVGKRIFVTGDEVGAFGLCNNLNDLLAWWITQWSPANIECPGVKASSIEALGLVPVDDDSKWDFRINGRLWRQTDRGSADA
jgi:hypothetical protein